MASVNNLLNVGKGIAALCKRIGALQIKQTARSQFLEYVCIKKVRLSLRNRFEKRSFPLLFHSYILIFLASVSERQST